MNEGGLRWSWVAVLKLVSLASREYKKVSVSARGALELDSGADKNLHFRQALGIRGLLAALVLRKQLASGFGGVRVRVGASQQCSEMQNTVEPSS